MIEVIPAQNARQSSTGSDTGTSAGKVELLAAAADFFADRLLTRKQQKRLSFFIEFTAQPVRGPISLDMLAGKSGLFGFRPPRLFEMTVSSAAGMRAALDAVAVEMVHIAQIMSERLQIFAKKRKIDGQREMALKARWLDKKPVFIDQLPKAERAWVVEADLTAQQLVGEFLAWSSGRIRTVPRQRPKGTKIGLYRVRPTKIAMPASSQIWGDETEDASLVPAISTGLPPLSEPQPSPAISRDFAPGIMPADFATANGQAMPEITPNEMAPNGMAPNGIVPNGIVPNGMVETHAGAENSPDGRQLMPASAAAASARPVDPQQMIEFAIFVEVPALGTTRRLNSGAFQGKLNDLLERGLIARDSVRAALRLADDRRRQRP